MEITRIFQTWYDSIRTKENQIRLSNSMNQVRKMRMTKHRSFHNMVLENLKNISELQAHAFAYWISTGNLCSVNPINKTYPNVTLTCINPLLNLGKYIFLGYTMF